MYLKFSQDIESLLKRLANQPLTLGQILAETSERWFSLSIGLLVLPFLFPTIPLTNPLPVAVIVLLATATLEANGLLMCYDYGLTIAVTFFFAFIGYGLWQASELLPNFFK